MADSLPPEFPTLRNLTLANPRTGELYIIPGPVDTFASFPVDLNSGALFAGDGWYVLDEYLLRWMESRIRQASLKIAADTQAIGDAILKFYKLRNAFLHPERVVPVTEPPTREPGDES